MLNNVCLVGRFVRNPELSITQNGNAVTNFCLAVQRNSGAGKEKITDFLDCVAWGKTAEFITQYLQKGNLVSLTGSIQTRNYINKDGKNIKVVEILVENVYFVVSKKQNTQDGQDVDQRSSDDEFLEISEPNDLPF